jgi:hypothetical protein
VGLGPIKSASFQEAEKIVSRAYQQILALQIARILKKVLSFYMIITFKTSDI